MAYDDSCPRGGACPPGRGPIFIFLTPSRRIVILADRLPRRYELLRADGGGDASRRDRRPLLGLILVILHINIICGCYISGVWIAFVTIVEKKT